MNKVTKEEIENTIELIEWATMTIREKLTFNQDKLNAAHAREGRAKGVLLDCEDILKRILLEMEQK